MRPQLSFYVGDTSTHTVSIKKITGQKPIFRCLNFRHALMSENRELFLVFLSRCDSNEDILTDGRK